MLRKWVFASLFILLLTAPSAFAQEDNTGSTQTYLSYDGWLTFEFPADWVADREGDDFGLGFFSIGSSPQALEVVSNNGEQDANDPLPPGEIAIIIARPEFLFRLTSGLDPSVPLMDVLTGFITAPEGTEINSQETTIAGYPALRADLADETSAGIILVMQFAPGYNLLMAASTTPEDLPRFEDEIMAIAETMHYGGLAETVLYHDYRLWDVGWSADGSKFYTRESDFDPGTDFIRVWDGETHEQLFRVDGDDAAFSPDGSKIVVTLFGQPGRILNAQTGEVLNEIDQVGRAVWKSDGSQILTSNSSTGVVALWDAATGNRVLDIDYSTFTPGWAFDDTVIVTSNFGDNPEMIHWDAVTGERILTVQGAGRITLNPDNTRYLYIDHDTTLVQAEYPSGKEIFRIQVEADNIIGFNEFFAPYWSPDETTIHANVGDCPPSFENCTLSAYVWDAETGELLFNTPETEEESFRAGVFLENGQIAGGLRGPNTIKVWNSTTGEVVTEIPTASFVYRMYLSPDGQQLIALEDGGIVRVYDVATWQQVAALLHDKKVNFVVPDASEQNRLVTSTENGMYTTWDLETGRELLRIGHGGKGDSGVVATGDLSPDGTQFLAFASGSLAARVFRQEDLIAERLAEYAAAPYSLDELDTMGFDALNNGDYDEAIRLYNEAITVDPDAAFILNGRAIAYYRQGDVQAAMADLNRAIVLDPTYIQPLKNRADIARLEGNPSSAVDDYTRVLELDPIDAVVYNNRGVAFANMREYQAAIDDFDAAIALDATYAKPYSNKGFVYSFMNRDEEALESMEAYIEVIGGEANATQEELDLLNTLRESVGD